MLLFKIAEPRIVIVRGNPGVFQAYPYPYPENPYPPQGVRVLVGQGKGFGGFGGFGGFWWVL
jgi:hypothetical protein